MLAQAVDETHRDCIRMSFAIERRALSAHEWVNQWQPRPCPPRTEWS